MATVTRSVMNPNRPPGQGAVGTSNGSNTVQMARKSYFNTSGQTLANLQIGYAGWRMTQSSEGDAPNAVVIDGAWLEYPAGTYTPFAFSGAASGTTTVGATHLMSDSLSGLSIPNGAQCWIWSKIHVTSGQSWDYSYLSAPGLGDKVEEGTTLTNTAPNSGMAAGASGAGMYAPAVIRSTASGLRPVLALVGDSIEAINDQPGTTTQGMQTWIGRACEGRMPLLQASYAGHQLYSQGASNYPCDAMPRRIAWFTACGATHGINCLGTNDIPTTSVATMTTTFMQNMWRTLLTISTLTSVYQMTYLPRTDNSGFKASDFQSPSTQTVNQSPSGAWTGGASSVRGQCNAYIRSSPANLTGVLEMADVVEVNSAGALTRNGSIWIAGNATGTPYLTASGTNAGATVDGTHPFIQSTSPEYGGAFIMRDAAVPFVNSIAGTGGTIVTGNGASVGSSSASGDGSAKVASVGTAIGIGTGAGSGGAQAFAQGSAAATSIALGYGYALSAGTGSAIAASITRGSGLVQSVGTGASNATSVASGAGSASIIGISTGAALGQATVSGVGSARVTAVGISAGLSSAAGVGSAVIPGISAGTAIAASAAFGVGLTLVQAYGSILGTSSAIGAPTTAVASLGAGVALGTSSALGVALMASVSTGIAAGMSQASASPSSLIMALGRSLGSSTALASGTVLMISIGAGVGHAIAIGSPAPLIPIVPVPPGRRMSVVGAVRRIAIQVLAA